MTDLVQVRLGSCSTWEGRELGPNIIVAKCELRLAQVITALPPITGGTSPEPSDVWETFFQLGEMLAATDTPERETFTAAVLPMHR